MKTFGLHPLAALGVALLLSACGSAPPKPASVTGTVEASAQVNPSASKRPSPILIRVYELKSVATFNGADFMSLYQRDQAELGGDFVAREEFVLAPGETRAFRKTLSPDTHFLGVVAAFRDLDRSTWRSVVAVDPNKNQQVVIKAAQLVVDALVTMPAAK